MSRSVAIGPLQVGGRHPLALFSGPCVIESRDSALRHASALRAICQRAAVPFVYKSSFDKANRTSRQSFRGPGLDEGLRILEEVRREVGVPVITDVHEARQAAIVAQVVDALQTPAFLCRQTDFLQACAETGKPVNVKKGQFLAPWDMQSVVDKMAATGNHAILVTERGASFGYNNLVADMRSLPILSALGFPVVYDAGHSVQLPGGQGQSSGGQRQFIAPLARAAVATGSVDAIFLEVHEEPDRALSDGPNSYPLRDLEALLIDLVRIVEITRTDASA